MLNVHSWSDHALLLVNSAAHIIAILAAAVVLISLLFIYFTGHEVTGRVKREPAPPGEGPGQVTAPAPPKKELAAARKAEKEKALRITQIEKELVATQKSEKAKSARIGQVEAELAAARKAEELKAIRVTQIEAQLAMTRKSEEANAIRATQVEAELVAARRSDEAKAIRLAEVEAELGSLRRSSEESRMLIKQLETELAMLRRSAEEAKTLAKELEVKQGPRKMTAEQRTQFLTAVRGQPTGKVIVSAFFDNKETHDFGAAILSLLKEAGFNVIERAPLNFFTTSRPSSGVRIGCENISNPPPHFFTLQKGFSAIGLETPTSTLINAQEEDVVEIQVTPKA